MLLNDAVMSTSVSSAALAVAERSNATITRKGM
jgi:hypothetical protein